VVERIAAEQNGAERNEFRQLLRPIANGGNLSPETFLF